MIDDNFHFGRGDERNEHGVFSSAEEAIAACKRIVDEDLKNSYRPGMSEAELYETYTMFGDDPFVMPIDKADKSITFSAWDYAKERCKAFGFSGTEG
ncbi:hypothetical protein AOQ71_01380 [Bradyrhizobium manausense]|uniref:Uncharacterized protein n=2 Tax=Bradyrhizobium manausense TaxID=989370 RepID=A0A0R3E6B1_9BRAD|nr:hypothetical protein AOQ71_01380 [Bradyrhizobium manausense]